MIDRMKAYTVTWTGGVDADSPEAAARQALADILNHDAEARVFVVTEAERPGGRLTDTTVDLSYEGEASAMTIRTNNVPRDVINGYELSADERAKFDHYDWPAILNGERDDPQFFRYRGELYDLGEFSADYGITRGAGLPAHLANWDGYMDETFFSAIVVRYVDDCERVIVGHVFS